MRIDLTRPLMALPVSPELSHLADKPIAKKVRSLVVVRVDEEVHAAPAPQRLAAIARPEQQWGKFVIDLPGVVRVPSPLPSFSCQRWSPLCRETRPRKSSMGTD